jgi:phosphate-selective porin OprO/OprP
VTAVRTRAARSFSLQIHWWLLIAGVISALAASPASAQSADEPPPRFRWEDHATFRFGPHVRMELRLRIQNDLRDTDGPLPAGEHEFRMPLKRFGVRGTIGRSIDYQVDRELVREDAWRDVFVNIRWRPSLNLRAGQFKLPFSLEETSPTTALDFMYRSRAARQLAPGRDPGAMAYGRLASGALRYEAGVFIRDGRNARRPNSDRVQGQGTLAGRVRVLPFAHAAPIWRALDVGVAATLSQLPSGLPALRGRTALDSTFYSPARIVDGTRRRIGVELAWLPGPFSVKSEYIRLSDDHPDDEAASDDLVATGWYVSGTWVVTGEAKAAGLNAPPRPVHRGGLGTIEVGARTESLRFRDGTGPVPESRIATAGVNWALNRWVRVQFNVIRERLVQPLERSRFWGRVFRVQFVV